MAETVTVPARPGGKVYEMGLSAKQMQAFWALHPDTKHPGLPPETVIELLFGGAKGGGKSVFGCKWTYFFVKLLILFFDLKPAKFPPVLGWMGRKQAVDFNTTTLVTWKRDIPADAYELKEQKKEIWVEDRAIIRYGGLDDRNDVQKFNSAEFVFVFGDQAEEMDDTEIAMLRGTLGRFRIGSKIPPYRALWTANPAQCVLKQDFISKPVPGGKFIQALPKDNPFLPAGYVEQLKKAFSWNPALLNAYLFGSWDDLDQAFTVIRRRHVDQAVNNRQYDKVILKKVTVVDVAGESEDSDETVIYDLENTRVVDQEIYAHRDLMDTVGRAMAHAKRNGSNLICIDKVGEGAGVYSRLCEIYADDPNMTIYGFDGRLTAPEGLHDQTYTNYKSYAWFKAAKMFAEKLCDIPDDPILKDQLSGVTWHYKSNGKMAVDPKDKLKEKMRSSPDRADAYVMGLDALDHAKPVKKVDRYGEPRRSYDRNVHPDAV